MSCEYDTCKHSQRNMNGARATPLTLIRVAFCQPYHKWCGIRDCILPCTAKRTLPLTLPLTPFRIRRRAGDSCSTFDLFATPVVSLRRRYGPDSRRENSPTSPTPSPLLSIARSLVHPRAIFFPGRSSEPQHSARTRRARKHRRIVDSLPILGERRTNERTNERTHDVRFAACTKHHYKALLYK